MHLPLQQKMPAEIRNNYRVLIAVFQRRQDFKVCQVCNYLLLSESQCHLLTFYQKVALTRKCESSKQLCVCQESPLHKPWLKA